MVERLTGMTNGFCHRLNSPALNRGRPILLSNCYLPLSNFSSNRSKDIGRATRLAFELPDLLSPSFLISLTLHFEAHFISFVYI
ncbi:hypothetical protein [Papaya meleira virus]|uniref:Uncharacterized protein n=1 Tax=Papaya meleira virus TaxID=1497848 RepID=A0A0N7JQJ6_9VIRU|nr:hypothetical protein [Papaya meleira virus]ALL54977.1 hypothetical protein [Papaya meleira virus]